jgi:hypothetical protein
MHGKQLKWPLIILGAGILCLIVGILWINGADIRADSRPRYGRYSNAGGFIQGLFTGETYPKVLAGLGGFATLFGALLTINRLVTRPDPPAGSGSP